MSVPTQKLVRERSRRRVSTASEISSSTAPAEKTEKIPHQVHPKPHFYRSIRGLFPHQLLDYSYEVEPVHNKVVYNKNFKVGDPVVEIDLSCWSGVVEALDLFYKKGSALRKIILRDNVEVVDETLEELKKFRDTLVHVDISYGKYITSAGLNTLFTMSNMRALIMSDVSVLTDNEMATMCKSMPYLEDLDICGCRSLTNESLKMISGSSFSKRLLRLNVGNNSMFSYVGMNPIIFHCTSLEELDLSYCTRMHFIGTVISADTTYGFNEPPMKQYVSCKLKVLTVVGCPMNEDCLYWIASGCPDLTHLNVSTLPNVSNSFIQAFSLACLSLQDINLRGCKSVDSAAVNLIARCKCRETLTSLNVSHVAPKQLHSNAIRNILERCGCLEKLDVSGNALLDDGIFHYRPNDAFKDKAPMIDRRRASSCLSKLCMAHCPLMSSEGILLLTTLHNGISFLDISGMKLLDDSAMKCIADGLLSLLVLRANDCLGFTGEGVVSVVRSFPQLTELHIGTSTKQTNSYGGRVEQYSDNTLMHILKNCRKLLVLDIRNQCGITMQSTFFKGERKGSFSGHCYLRTLKLQGADNILPSNLATVLSKCFALEDVVLPGDDASGVFVEDSFFEKYTQSLSGTQGDDVSVNTTNEESKSIDSSQARSKASKKIIDPKALKEQRKRQAISEIADKLRVKYSDPAHPKHLWDQMFKHCCYAKFYKTFDSEPTFEHIPNGIYPAGSKWGWGGLFPDERRDIWRLRDQFVVRIMDEMWAAKKIQYNYRISVRYRILRDHCTSRRIQRWYRWKKTELALHVIRDRLFVLNCALRIQRNFRRNLLPCVRAIVLMQRRVRGWKGRKAYALFKLKNKMATEIQKIVRGMLVRLSDWFILAQIYVKLPPFWKTVIHSTLPEGTSSSLQFSNIGHFHSLSKSLREEEVDAYGINKEKERVQHLIKGIEAKRMVAPDDIGLANGEKKQLYLAPKLPIVVPQYFDKNPYASRRDGKKVAIFGCYNDIVRKEIPQYELVKRSYATKDAIQFKDTFGSEEGRDYVHQFTYTFWPLRQPVVEDTADVSLFDPKLNGFDVRLNSRHSLRCEMCGIRLRLINCRICTKGFCFFCAFKQHADGAKRNHTMEMTEPRVIKSKEASTSLIYHLDMVQKTTYDIKYLVGFLKSASEVNRLQKERIIRREMADLAEKRKEQAAAAALVAKHLHEAATKIANSFRKKQSVKYVATKRSQTKLEKDSKEVRRVNEAATRIQARFRVFSVRNYFYKVVGERFRVNFKKRKKKREKKSAAEELKRMNIKKKRIRERVLHDVHQRRLNDRKQLIWDVFDEFALGVEMVKANTDYWLGRYDAIAEKLAALRAEKKKFAMEYKTNEGLLNEARATGRGRDEIKEKSLVVKALYLKRGACAQRVENYKSMNWWISHHIRSNCRRSSTMEARMDDLVKRLRWFADEHFVVSRIVDHLKLRIQALKDNKDLRLAYKWMNDFVDHANALRGKFDAMQESLLSGELRRIRTDCSEFKTMDALVRELLDGMKIDAQYAVERTFLDCRALYAVAGSDEAVSVGNRSLELKKKQGQLQTSVIDNVKLGLDERLTQEDSAYIDIAAFPNDADHLKAHEMPDKIKAQLVERFIGRKHFDLKNFIDVIMSQPWMANQAMEDVHLEEEFRLKELHLDEVKANVKNLEMTIVNFRKDCVNAEKNIEELETEIEVIETEDPKYFDPEEWAEMQANLARFKTEVDAKRAEIRLKTNLANTNEENLPEMRARMEFLEIKHKKAVTALEGRNEARLRLLEDYMAVEESLVDKAVKDASDCNKVVAKELVEMKESKRKIESVPFREIPDQLLECNVDMEMQHLLQESNFEPKYAVYQNLHLLSPDSNPTSFSIIKTKSERRAQVYQSNIDHFNFRSDIHNQECQLFSSLSSRKEQYKQRMHCFVETQMLMRRQHSLQKELENRRKRLKRMRAVRMEAIREAREKALAEEQRKVEEAEERRKARESAKTVASVVAAKLKSNIRKTADEYRRFKMRRAQNMDAEEERMATYIRLKTKKSELEAIRSIKITGTLQETQQFQKQNDILAEKGLPFYRKINRGIGSQGDVFIWVEMTTNSAEFVTHIDISHSDPAHPMYKKMSTFGYQEVSNPNIKMVLWIKKDKRKNTAINALKVSYESGEEARLIVDEFQRVGDGELSLSNFGLPDIFLWYHKVDKDDSLETINTNSIIGELNNVRKMIKERPDDDELLKLEKKLVAKLSSAHSAEVEAQGVNPITHAVDLLALSDKQLHQWMKIYAKVDKDKSGSIEFDEMCEFLGEAPTKFVRYVFDEMDSFNSDGVIEFSDFLRTFAIFCMFGKDEVLRTCFQYADTDRVGYITHEQLIKLLNQLHPFDKQRTKRALAELDMSPEKVMTWNEFNDINGRLPTILYPAFRLQFAMRDRTMGEDWWLKKLRKYKGVREKLLGSKTNADDVAKLEMERAENDLKREERMKNRELEIKQTTSAIKKVILNARQIADEFS